MRIKDLLDEKGTEVITIDSDQSIHAAIVKLNHHGIGSLIVTGEDGHIAVVDAAGVDLLVEEELDLGKGR